MKKTIIYLIILHLCFIYGCNDDFLERLPSDELTEENSFITHDNFQTYSYGLYNIFTGYGNGNGNQDWYKGDIDSDNMQRIGGDRSYSNILFDEAITPSSGGGWNFGYIRRVNTMLVHIDDSQMSDIQKKHWRGVGYFFKSMEYFDLMNKFGDVPWIEGLVNTTDTEILYGKRDSRDMIADKILEMLEYSIENTMPNNGNVITCDVARALMSRFGLFEGTWRKYHNLGNAEKYLEASAKASKELIDNYPELHPDFDEVWNSEDLNGKPGILLYKEYLTDAMTHFQTRLIRTGSNRVDMTKDAVSSYLCIDGKTTENSEDFKGDKDIYDEFWNRDHRLYYTVSPPYNVKRSKDQVSWEYTDNEKDRMYIDFMESITKPTMKRLPLRSHDLKVTRQVPNFREHSTSGAQRTRLGYTVYKFYNTHTPSEKYIVNTTDAPLFRMGEVLVNYAEVMWELGKFDQAVADITLNKTRARGSLPPMKISEISTDFDPDRDLDIEPLLWEIRRERRIELMGEGYRFDDLRRWNKCAYWEKQKIGVWIDIKKSKYPKLKVTGGNSQTEGYVYYFNKPSKSNPKYLLSPLPLDQLILNKNLTQNPGWDEAASE